MVNIVDTERLLKTIIAQFCDQNFKFTVNLKILGSIHVVVDNTEVLTCLLDEKYFKQPSVVRPNSGKLEAPPPPPQLNLVTTLNQLGTQAPASLSSKSTSSSSSTCSSSSYSSADSSASNHNKRKRFVPRGLLSTATAPTNGNMSNDDDEEDEDEVHVKHEMESNGQSNDATPVKRGKMVDETDEQAAATTLSLISASKMLMAPQLLGGYHHQQHYIPQQQTYQSNQPNGTQASQQPIMKPKSKYIREQQLSTNEQQLKQQIMMQQLPGGLAAANNGPNYNYHHQSGLIGLPQTISAGGALINNPPTQPMDEYGSAANGAEDTANGAHDSDSDDNQLFMDEDHPGTSCDDDKTPGAGASSSAQPSSSSSSSSSQPQNFYNDHHQHLMMAAAAAALSINNDNKPCNPNDPNLKLFMPQHLALNLAAVKQEQIQNAGPSMKKKKKQQQQQDQQQLMSPSSSSSTSSNSLNTNLMQLNGPSSNKSTTSTSSSSSGSVSASAKNKSRRQTIATLAAAAAASRQMPSSTNNTTIDLQRNLVALATHIGINKAAAAAAVAAANNSNENMGQMNQQPPAQQTTSFDQIIQEMTMGGGDKAKLLATFTPKVHGSKHIKKQHLLSASLNSSPNIPSAASPNGGVNLPTQKPPKTKKPKAVNGHFGDTMQPNQMGPTNPAVSAAAAAAAAALQYHQMFNNSLAAAGKVTGNTPGALTNATNTSANSTPQKPLPDKGPYYGDGEGENQDGEGAHDEEKPPMIMGQQASQQQLNGEFECEACEKKFKYFCYYKRHMDACHSEWPKYVCDTCNKSYKWEASFRQHLRSHHQTGGQNGAAAASGGSKEEEDKAVVAAAQAATAAAASGAPIPGDDDEDHVAPPPDDDNDDDVSSSSAADIDPGNVEQPKNTAYHMMNDRDNEQMGAAGTLASIAESINAAIMCSNRDTS